MSENRRRRNNGAQNTQVKKARTNNARRILLLVGLMSLVAVISIGGTIAWLTDSTQEVTNTFTAAGIDITLTETWNAGANPDDPTSKNDHWEVQLIPGKTYEKNPVVAVTRPDTDVDIYLFVKVEDNISNYVTYTSLLNADNGWTQLSTTDGSVVWYRTVTADETNSDGGAPSWHLIDNDTVTVKSTLVKAGSAVDGDGNTNMPSDAVTLKYTAYAIQTEGFNTATSTVADAWAKVSSL